jgi:hypothetical protein
MRLLQILLLAIRTVQSLLSYNLEENQHSGKQSHIVYSSPKNHHSYRGSTNMFYSTIKYSNKGSSFFNVERYNSRHKNKHSMMYNSYRYSNKHSSSHTYNSNLFSTMVQSYRALPEQPVHIGMPTYKPTSGETTPYLPYDDDMWH